MWLYGLRVHKLADAATGDAASLLNVMETGFGAAGAVPFRGIKDRVWWISNATTEARVVHFGLAYENVSGKRLPDDGPVADDEDKYYYSPKDLAVKEAFCFVAAGANDTTSGPSGVVCTSEDFKGVFQGTCRYDEIVGDWVRIFFFAPAPEWHQNRNSWLPLLVTVIPSLQYLALGPFNCAPSASADDTTSRSPETKEKVGLTLSSFFRNQKQQKIGPHVSVPRWSVP